MRGGKGAKRKGSAFEREVVNAAKSMGLKAYRVPLSGAVDFFEGDCFVAGRRIECKRRHKLPAFVEENLKPGTDALILGGDRQRSLVVVRLEDWLKLL